MKWFDVLIGTQNEEKDDGNEKDDDEQKYDDYYSYDNYEAPTYTIDCAKQGQCSY